MAGDAWTHGAFDGELLPQLFDVIVVDMYMSKAGGARNRPTAHLLPFAAPRTTTQGLTALPLTACLRDPRPTGQLLGSETVQQLKKQHCKSLMIGCSANHNEVELQERFLEAGAAACWPKPLPDLGVIRSQLKDLLPSRLPGQVRVLIVDDLRLNRKMLR